MNSIGKIGLIMPEITDPLDYELLDGIYGQAEKLGYDVVVFTGVLNSMSDEKRGYYTEGFENIYSLICKSSLDGLFLPPTVSEMTSSFTGYLTTLLRQIYLFSLLNTSMALSPT